MKPNKLIRTPESWPRPNHFFTMTFKLPPKGLAFVLSGVFVVQMPSRLLYSEHRMLKSTTTTIPRSIFESTEENRSVFQRLYSYLDRITHLTSFVYNVKSRQMEDVTVEFLAHIILHDSFKALRDHPSLGAMKKVQISTSTYALDHRNYGNAVIDATTIRPLLGIEKLR